MWFYCLPCSNTSETLPFSTTKNITCVGLSPDGSLAIVVDEGTKYFQLRFSSGLGRQQNPSVSDHVCVKQMVQRC